MKKTLSIAFIAVICSTALISCNRTQTDTTDVTETKQNVSVTENTTTSEGNEKNVSEVIPDINLTDTMSDTEKRELNAFISNFTEAHCRELGEDVEYNDFYKINFAYIHNLINKPNQKIIYNDILGKYGIEAEEVDTILERYFGETVPHKTATCISHYEIEGKVVTRENVYEYTDNIFWIPAASGESYEYFAIATDMRDNGDGTYNVKFNEYWDQAHIHEGMQPQWYSYTPEEAAEECVSTGTGIAKVRKKEYNGENTYELISFKAET